MRVTEKVEKKLAAMTPAQRTESRARANAMLHGPSPAAPREASRRLAADYLSRAAARIATDVPASAAVPGSRVAILKAEVETIRGELAACPPCGPGRWVIAARLDAAVDRLENFCNVPAAELRQLMAITSNPLERFRLAAALAEATNS
jgi:hypothetical protein